MRHTKIALAAAAFVTATVFRILDIIDQHVWANTVGMVLGVYGLANVGATVAHGLGGKWRKGG